MKIDTICNRYNTYVNVMIKNSKRITTEQTRAYHAAFEGKKAIEKTLRDMGYKLDFEIDGSAIDIIAIGD